MIADSEAIDPSGGRDLTAIAASAVQPWLPDLSVDDQSRVEDFITRASASATLRAYRPDWRQFCAWCDARGYHALPATPRVTAAFLTELATTGSSHSNKRSLSKA